MVILLEGGHKKTNVRPFYSLSDGGGWSIYDAALWHVFYKPIKGKVSCQNLRDKGPPERNSARG